jgi:hypothetical protein
MAGTGTSHKSRVSAFGRTGSSRHSQEQKKLGNESYQTIHPNKGQWADKVQCFKPLGLPLTKQWRTTPRMPAESMYCFSASYLQKAGFHTRRSSKRSMVTKRGDGREASCLPPCQGSFLCSWFLFFWKTLLDTSRLLGPRRSISLVVLLLVSWVSAVLPTASALYTTPTPTALYPRQVTVTVTPLYVRSPPSVPSGFCNSRELSSRPSQQRSDCDSGTGFHNYNSHLA